MTRLRGIALLALVLILLAVRPPASAAVQPGNPYPERLRSLIAEERARVLAGEPGDPEFLDRAAAILREWHSDRIAPGLQAAARDCAVAEAEDGIVPEALAWAQGIELLTGGGDEAGTIASLRPLIPEIYDALADALVRCYEEAKERCVRDADLTQPPRMLSLAKQLQLFGSTREPGDVFGDIERCLTFELEFESQIMQRSGDGRNAANWHVRAVVPLQRDTTDSVTGLDASFTGQAPLRWVAREIGMAGCFAVFWEQESTFTVNLLRLTFGRPRGPAMAPAILTVLLEYEPGMPLEREQAAGQGCSGGASGPGWAMRYDALHADEAVTRFSGWDLCGGRPSGRYTSGRYLARAEWQGGERPVVAQVQYSKTHPNCPGYTPFSDTTTITIRHTPRR